MDALFPKSSAISLETVPSQLQTAETMPTRRRSSMNAASQQDYTSPGSGKHAESDDHDNWSAEDDNADEAEDEPADEGEEGSKKRKIRPLSVSCELVGTRVASAPGCDAHHLSKKVYYTDNVDSIAVQDTQSQMRSRFANPSYHLQSRLFAHGELGQPGCGWCVRNNQACEYKGN